MSLITTLSDVGYRPFGPLPATGPGLDAAQAAAVAAKCCDYEVAGAWVRRRARKKGGCLIRSFDIIEVLDRDTELTDERLAFVDDYFRSEFTNADVPRLTTESENLVNLIESARTEECRWRGMYRLDQALWTSPRMVDTQLRVYTLLGGSNGKTATHLHP